MLLHVSPCDTASKNHVSALSKKYRLPSVWKKKMREINLGS